MNQTEVKEWLDSLVRIYKETKERKYFNSEIYAYFVMPRGILIEKIEEVADIMQLELVEEVTENEELMYRYSFEYRNVTFVDYRRERIEQHVHMQ